MSDDYQQLQQVAESLIPTICAARGKLFGREIIVTEETHGGEIQVTPSRLLLNPFALTAGNPVVFAMRAINLTEEYDRKRQKAAKKVLDSLKHHLRVVVRELYALDPEAALTILREEIGLEEEPLHIELV